MSQFDLIDYLNYWLSYCLTCYCTCKVYDLMAFVN